LTVGDKGITVNYNRYNTVTVLSMNVRGLFSSVKKRNDVFDWAKGKR
jgi:hypothetical protein